MAAFQPFNLSRANPRTSNDTANKTKAQKYLTDCKSLYSCIYCHTHLANHDELVSRSFQGNHGRAYLFNTIVNVRCGPSVQRELNTGSHAVADIHCTNCDTNLGWKYEKAYVNNQKYKEGKYIIELAHVVRENRHLELDKGVLLMSGGRGQQRCSKSSLDNVGSKNSASSSNVNRNGNFIGSNDTNRRPNCAISLSPASGNSELSSPVTSGSSNEDFDDEELMFPFYDDMLATSGNSSYTNRIPYSNHSRTRRSLYLDSTPYDWKLSSSVSTEPNSSLSASPPLASQAVYTTSAQPKLTKLSSITKSDPVNLLASSSISSPQPIATSSSSIINETADGAMSHVENAIHMNANNRNKHMRSRRSDPLSNRNHANYNDEDYYDEDSNQEDENQIGNMNVRTNHINDDNDDDDETQFNLETDRITSADDNRPSVIDSDDHSVDKQATLLEPKSKICGPKNSGGISVNNRISQGLSNGTLAVVGNGRVGCSIKSEGSSNDPINHVTGHASTSTKKENYSIDHEANQQNLSSANSSSATNQFNSISLDDEEFYDCCTEHDVLAQ